MSQRKVLSICIPTYNRAKFLKENLDTIVSQFSDPKIKEGVEVVISDNGSTDNTTEVVKEYQSKFDNIIYNRNEKNIGFDRNLLKVVEKSTGQYCLTIGDDDGFFPNSFSILLDRISTLKCDYYLLNHWGYDHDLLKPVTEFPSRRMIKDEVYPTLADFVRSIKVYHEIIGSFGGMSVQLFARDIWMNFDGKEAFLDTQFVHRHTLLSAYKDKSFALLAAPIIKTRNENMRWDMVPGYENIWKRTEKCIESLLWVKNAYDLPIPTWRIYLYFWYGGAIDACKNVVKRILRALGLRR